MNELSLLGLRDGGEAGLWVWVAMLCAGVVQLNREPPGPVGGAGGVNKRPLDRVADRNRRSFTAWVKERRVWRTAGPRRRSFTRRHRW